MPEHAERVEALHADGHENGGASAGLLYLGHQRVDGVVIFGFESAKDAARERHIGVDRGHCAQKFLGRGLLGHCSAPFGVDGVYVDKSVGVDGRDCVSTAAPPVTFRGGQLFQCLGGFGVVAPEQNSESPGVR